MAAQQEQDRPPGGEPRGIRRLFRRGGGPHPVDDGSSARVLSPVSPVITTEPARVLDFPTPVEIGTEPGIETIQSDIEGAVAVGAPAPTRIHPTIEDSAIQVAASPIAPAIPKEEVSESVRVTRRGFIKGTIATLLGAAAATALYKAAERVVAQPETRPRPLGPETNQSVDWWRELSTEEIQLLAEIPSIDILDSRHKQTVSPVLQERAKQAGYELIYQHDPQDTTGRTVIAKGRYNWSKDWTLEDQGFGRAGGRVGGIFQAWVPDPEDSTQQDHIYALLKNPNSGGKYLVRMELQSFDPNSPIRPTWFAVDDLSNGPSIIQEKSKAAGFDLPSEQILTSQDLANKKWKKPSEFPTFDDLLRKQGLFLTELVKPGDYIRVVMQTAGVDEAKGDFRYKTDDMRIARAGEIVVRRFGGEKQWREEIQNTHR